MAIQLQPDEMIQKEGGASHVKGIETVGGHLWLTNLRLFFKSHALNIQVHEESYPLQEIASIHPHGLVPTWMYVTLRNKRQEKFVVFGREEWIGKIAEALRQSRAANAPVQDTSSASVTESDAARQPSSVPTSTSQPAYTTPPEVGLSPVKERSIALVLEVLPGLFGLFGIGWIYSGNTTAGVLWLIGVMTWNCIALTSAVLTSGFACICTVPASWVMLAISAVFLHSYTKQHPEVFGA
jgi:hypothetical protein